MVVISFILGALCLALVYFAFSTMAPWSNKLLSRVWSEDIQVKREAIDRVKELYINGEMSDESALMIASVENGESENNILAAFSAMDARDLAKIVRGQPRGIPLRALAVLESVVKRNMKRVKGSHDKE